MSLRRFLTLATLRWVLILLTFSVFFARSVISLDPDFGWHYKMGELILSAGIPKTDPFSYTMPSFAFVDHEWLTNVLVYLGQTKLTYTVLAAVFAVIAVAALTLPFSKADSLESWLVFLLAAGSLVGYTGVRPQLISWFLLAVVTAGLTNPKVHRYLLGFPALVLVWTNLHGSFPIALVVYGMWVVGGWLQDRRVRVGDCLVVLVAIGATFVNPYGGRVWEEVFRQFSDGNLHWSIAEWLPTVLITNFPLSLYAVISVYFVGKYRAKFETRLLVIYAVLFLQGLSAFRHAPLWVIFSLPLTFRALTAFRDSLPRVASSRYVQARQFAFALAGTLFAINSWLGISSGSQISAQRFYPVEAVRYLSAHGFEGQLFSNYGWGGYLIWQLPDQKVFVDGRMPSWRWSEAPFSESIGAFDDYTAIVAGKTSFDETAKNYGITKVLWPKSSKSSLRANFSDKISDFLGLPNDDFGFEETLLQTGWRVEYEDSVAVVYSAN